MKSEDEDLRKKAEEIYDRLSYDILETTKGHNKYNRELIYSALLSERQKYVAEIENLKEQYSGTDRDLKRFAERIKNQDEIIHDFRAALEKIRKEHPCVVRFPCADCTARGVLEKHKENRP